MNLLNPWSSICQTTRTTMLCLCRLWSFQSLHPSQCNTPRVKWEKLSPKPRSARCTDGMAWKNKRIDSVRRRRSGSAKLWDPSRLSSDWIKYLLPRQQSQLQIPTAQEKTLSEPLPSLLFQASMHEVYLESVVVEWHQLPRGHFRGSVPGRFQVLSTSSMGQLDWFDPSLLSYSSGEHRQHRQWHGAFLRRLEPGHAQTIDSNTKILLQSLVLAKLSALVLRLNMPQKLLMPWRKAQSH